MNALVNYIAEKYLNVAEIGIGRYPDVAYGLVLKGINVIATDLYPLNYKGVKFFVDDITEPDISIYDGAGLIYSIRPAPELVFYMKKLAKTIKADLIVKSLSSEFHDGELKRNKSINFYLWDFYKM